MIKQLEPQFMLLPTESSDSESMVQVKPFGIHVATDGMKPVLLLKDEVSGMTLPVHVSPVDAAVAIALSNPQTNPVASSGSPHRFATEILASLQVKVVKAKLLDVEKGVQLMTFELENHPHLTSLKVRADECMSFCLQLQIPIFASQKFIQESRVLIQTQQLQVQATGTQFRQLQRSQGYLM